MFTAKIFATSKGDLTDATPRDDGEEEEKERIKNCIVSNEQDHRNNAVGSRREEKNPCRCAD